MRVTPQELKTMLLDGGELALLDVREAGEFGEAHLLFATPLPYSRLELDVPTLVPRNNVRIVLCDAGDGVANRAATRLSAVGYTDIRVLEGGTRGWQAAGHALFAGVNVPSKLFGELVEHAFHTPRVTVSELKAMREAGEDVVVVDGRPVAEYQKMNIPGGICCPNAELPLRIGEIVKRPTTKIVVNCAGRTRSILGAQTLINFGIDNPVYALENGTQGWVLADLELERGANRRYPDRVAEDALPRLRKQASALMEKHGAGGGGPRELWAGGEEADRTTYLVDVRTPEEFAAGSLPGAVHAPGGQLIQATDQWVGVRNARIVLIDNEGVRAPVVASWLRQLGHDAYVLEGGTTARVTPPAPSNPALPQLAAVTAAELKDLLDRSACSVIDLRQSLAFRKTHIRGAQWSVRPRVGDTARGLRTPVVLVADEAELARAAAIDLLEIGITEVKLLEGGFAAWVSAGHATQSSPNVPADRDCIDYLWFVHDRHTGNRDAMKQYLAWETGLIAQLQPDERSLFRI